MDSNSRILIFGGAGLVGGTLGRILKERGFQKITCVDRLEGDFCNVTDVDLIYSQCSPEYVFNCAAKVGGIKVNRENSFDFLLENLNIQNNIISKAITYKVKKFLNLGSACIYPKNYEQPLSENALLKGSLEETNEGYAIAKIAGLKLCEYANKESRGVNFISLMPSNLYGPRNCFDLNTSHVIGALIRKIVEAKKKNTPYITIWGTGKTRRDFLYVDDLCDGMIWAMQNIDKTSKFLNIGPGKDISIVKLVNKIADIVGYKCEVQFDLSKPDGMARRCLDVSKINALGWKALTTLEEGLLKTIEYYEKMR